jgi:hypothetical protein
MSIDPSDQCQTTTLVPAIPLPALQPKNLQRIPICLRTYVSLIQIACVLWSPVAIFAFETSTRRRGVPDFMESKSKDVTRVIFLEDITYVDLMKIVGS